MWWRMDILEEQITQTMFSAKILLNYIKMRKGINVYITAKIL